LSRRIENLHFYNLTTIYLQPHVLNIRANCFGFYWTTLEVFIEEFVNETRFANVAVSNNTDLYDWDILLFFDSREYCIPNHVGSGRIVV